MTAIAPMSSTIASVSRNTRSWVGQREPSSASTPSTNAMSVAITIPQPLRAGAAGVDREVEQRRHHHPAERGDAGTAARRRSRSSPIDELAPDLEADDEEEDHHQAVVDPVREVLA